MLDLAYLSTAFEWSTEVSCVTRGQALNCHLCRLLKPYSKENIDCTEVVASSCNQAERFGGRYISFCPMGLVHFASRHLAAGPLLLISHEEFFQEEIQAMYQLPESVEEQLETYLKSIKYVLPPRVSYMSEILYLTTACYTQNKSAHRSRNKTVHQSILSAYVHEIKKADKTVEYPYNKERQLLMTITQGNKPEAQKLLNEILAYIFVSSAGDLEVTKARVLELVVLFTRSAISGGADYSSLFSGNFDYPNKINNFDNVEELLYWLWEVMNECLDMVFNVEGIKHKDVIHKAITYINAHCTEKISLEQVSEHVYLSPPYFSKIFKEEMGQSFINYLNSTRVGKAKNILSNEDVPLIEVAGLAGFEDQSYFSKVFKKITGDTPGNYRRQNTNRTTF